MATQGAHLLGLELDDQLALLVAVGDVVCAIANDCVRPAGAKQAGYQLGDSNSAEPGELQRSSHSNATDGNRQQTRICGVTALPQVHCSCRGVRGGLAWRVTNTFGSLCKAKSLGQ